MKRKIRKIKRHFKRWNYWRKRSANSKLQKLLVLLGLARSSTFRNTLLPGEIPTKFFYENDKFCSISEVDKTNKGAE